MTEQTLPWTTYEDSTYCYSTVQNNEYCTAPQHQFATSSSLSSGSGSPTEMVNQRSPSPVDARTKNARAQARHRAKRKAYIENLETSVRQLRIAVTAGLSPQAQAQAQILERENARLRAEAQYLRSQLVASNNGPLTAPISSSWGGPSHGAVNGQNGNIDRTPAVRVPYIAGTMGPIVASTRTSPSPSSYAGHSRLRTAYSAENLRISGRSPENRRRRAPYAPVDSIRRDVHRQSSSQSQQDFQYTPRQFHTQATDASLDGSPYQQSSQPSSYSSSTTAEGFDQMNASTNTTYSYTLKPDQQTHYQYQNQAQYEEQDDPTVYSETAIVAPQAQPCYPPLSDYTATTFGLNGCAPQYTAATEDIKPLVH